jgi:hypothetical protein
MNRTFHTFVPWSAVVAAAAIAAVLTVASASARSLPTSPIDGRWTATLTRTELIRTGEVNLRDAFKLYGPYTAQFADGHFRALNKRTGRGAAGTFTVTGRLVRFVFAYGVGVKPGTVGVCTESVYRDRLTFARVPGRACEAFEAAVWTRVK